MKLSSPFPRRLAGAAAVALALAVVPAIAQLPSLGGSGDLTTGAERKLGEQVAREMFRDPDYIDDPVTAEYVQSIWDRLLAAARARGEITPDLDERYPWHVMLGKDREVNAFAVPGGWLGLQMGLVSITASSDELASVLAHELSHVTQRHISRMMEQSSKQGPLVLAAMLLGALAASRNPDMGGAVFTGSQAFAAQQQLSFSRDMEREADRIGYGVMTQAGFQPQGFVTMFEKLQQAARLTDNNSYPFLRTHPLTTERVADMQARQQLLPQTPIRPTMEHTLVAARARAISSPGVDGLRALMADADSGTLKAQPRLRQAAVLYSATYAAESLREWNTAARLLPRLDQAVAGDAAGERLSHLLAAEVALAQGDPARTLQLVDVHSKRRPELLLAAQAQIRTGHAAEAADRLQTWVTNLPRDGTAWQLLSSAYAAEGQTLRAIRAEAEGRVAQLDYKAALDRLKAAQDLARKRGAHVDDIEASIIDTRTRAVESLVREQALER